MAAQPKSMRKFHFLAVFRRKTSIFGQCKLKMATNALMYDGYSAIFLIMRSFKTIKVELFQLDPTPGFGLATPMFAAFSDNYFMLLEKSEKIT